MPVKHRYHHLGVPTTKSFPGEIYLKDYKCHYYGLDDNEYGIEFMRYEQDCPIPEIVKTVPHIAFEVEDMDDALRGKHVIIEPNSPSDGTVVAFIEENGIPVEFIQFTKK